MTYGGQCTCGGVRYSLAKAPFAVHCCHCRSCQCETGSAFALNGLIESEFVSVTAGEPEMIDTPSESGKGQRVARCPACKVALWSHYGGMGDKAAFVRIGTLDDPDQFPPHLHIFVRSKQPWVVLPESEPAYDVFYSKADFDTLFGVENASRYRTLRGI